MAPESSATFIFRSLEPTAYPKNKDLTPEKSSFVMENEQHAVQVCAHIKYTNPYLLQCWEIAFCYCDGVDLQEFKIKNL